MTTEYHKDFTEKYNNAKKLKSRDKDFEKQILKEAKKMGHEYDFIGCHIAHKYVRDVIKSRWEKLEQIYLEKNTVPKKGEGLYCTPWRIAFNYSNVVIKNRWDELEDKIIQLVESCGVIDFIYEYCKNTIKGRWEELENIIIDPQYKHFSARHLYEYALNVIKDRWPEAEKHIKKEPVFAYYYAHGVIKDRYPEAENTIKTSPYAYYYARDLIKDRWKEAEGYITNGRQYHLYKKIVNKKIINLLQNKNYEEVLTYCDFKDFTNIIKNAEKKHHIPNIIRNVMIANTLIGNNNDDSKKFMMQDKVFKQKMKDFLNDYKGIMVDDLIKKL